MYGSTAVTGTFFATILVVKQGYNDVGYRHIFNNFKQHWHSKTLCSPLYIFLYYL